ncbi:ATP-grasp domain-containing protein [Prevotella lacticifex]|uniref:Carbamoyl-phosphate-synthetase n=1 Tax=Prevotella lacticifex TaxID=2854755 RepID=A0A9R1CXQ7_9BACT|nr:ATP-grasp domain-containing protein [Prevotella lacticifex]GJG37459.1 carbamoyl-phosphate-synthetase [Prevotella lacticifex]GJG40640.1 carbamoyl-phosphate-synthetase [Prevotella lacticifex]GJG44337.1 carbamoyl-phosphate-synthetase [Prevotella lacticifex]GJG47022.1 carbamoyl-phosphate-synthetase [Prevotella lacticifex]GJG50356.1 carbamoyl-phosphate-synthetase [Prevotella lacticifex]
MKEPFLGGLRYLLPVIEAAHQQGYYVITCDYLPHNIAHKYSDEYVDVSIVDKEAVLKVAREKKIDGIMSFAVDPGVITASYVQNEMGLPSFGPYESVCILQNKDRFRAFLTEHGFNVPKAKGFGSMDEALAAKDWYPWPVIVKPTDSAGSKGVSRVDRFEDLKPALEDAFEHSISGRVIVEEFIEKQGCSSDSDSFSLDGGLVFTSFSAQRFDRDATNEYVPAAYSWPSTFTDDQEAYLKSELQRLLTLLHMQTSVYNIETRIGTNGKQYIMEVSPRGGGNRLAEMARMGTGVDIITACVRAAVGDSVPTIEQKTFDGHWAEVILHSEKTGKFKQLNISPEVVPYIKQTDLWVKPGDTVNTFRGANDTIGTLVMRFDTEKKLLDAMDGVNSWCKVETD